VSRIELQQENEMLKAQLRDTRAALANRDKQIVSLKADVATLKAQVERLLATRSGGHAVNPNQALLFPSTQSLLEAPVAKPAAVDEVGDDAAGQSGTDKPANPKKGGGSRKPRKIDTVGLRTEDRLHDVPESQRVDPQTGAKLVPIGEKVFEELEYKRAELFVVRHRQMICGLPPEQAAERQVKPVMAELPPRPLENCAASATLLAWTLVQKYGNHLPLYRQEEIFGRDGLRLSRQTLCDWVLGAANALRPIADCMLARIRSGSVLQIDDTPVMCQAGVGEPNFQAYLWTFVNPEVPGVAFRFTAGRGSDLLAAEIGGFSGTMVGDGYSGNRAAAKKTLGDIVIAGCWAHVNRKFRDAESEAPGTAKLFRDDIKKLYEIEHEADAAGLDFDARKALRQKKAVPVLIAIYTKAWLLRGQSSDAGIMAKAIGYARGQHRALRQFLEDGRIPIDNNACERSIRPIAIGRRNWLFAGSMRGGRAAAVVYTLIECCRLANVDMVSYLADVLVRVATHPASRVAELLPAEWAKSHAAPLATATVSA
jgi:transposase